MSIAIEKIKVSGFEAAFRGMRNPLNSWDKSDSIFDGKNTLIGPNDISLAKRLCGEGSPNRKFLRMIHVSMDVTAPLYWWKEYDTYKVATVSDSCSTMHTIHKKKFELDDFSHEHMTLRSILALEQTIQVLNEYRDAYLESKDKRDWWQLIQLLPSSYNQKRTLDLNYETLLMQIHPWREHHKLDEWRKFCRAIETLPYAKELMGIEH